MPDLDRKGWCVLVYDGTKANADHLRGAFNLKNVSFRSGQPVEVHPEFATLTIESAPPGTISVLTGTPAKVSIPGPAQARQARELRERMGPGLLSVGAREVARPVAAEPVKVHSKV